MKRRKPLVSKTPLATVTPIRRKTPLRPTRHIKRKGPRRGFTTPVSARCIAAFPGCTGVATDRHHRKRRRSGDHSPENRCDLCSHCHHTVIHRNPQWAYAHGWLVHSWEQPGQVPLLFGCSPGCSCEIGVPANKLGAASDA